MTRVSRIQSALFAATILLGSIVMFDSRTRAIAYGNCQDVTASWDWGNTYYCGEYIYENDALPGMGATMTQYVQDYYWGTSVELYWWSRVTPFDQPAYYQAGWRIQ